MNTEADSLVIPREQLSLEELEKKYFKRNANYYSNKQGDTNFDSLELSEKDLQVLRSQVGDQEEGVPSPKAEEELTVRTADNQVDVRQLRAAYPSAREAWREKLSRKFSLKSRESQLHCFLYLNFAIALYSIGYHLFVNLSLNLLVCYLSRLVLFFRLRILNSQRQNDHLHSQICGFRKRMFQVDLFVLLWPPFRQIILALVFPHFNWSPMNPMVNENYSFFLTLLIVGNHYLMKKCFAAEAQD